MANIKLGAARSPNGLGVFRGHDTHWVFKRTLAFMSESAAEIGECLFVARRINETGGESWIKEWADLAGRVQTLASDSLRKRYEVGAGEALLRALNAFPES
jgi:hypothetical protein